MNMAGTLARDLAGARPLANHCAELVESGPRPEERAETLSMWCRDLAGEMAQELGQLFSAGKLHVTIADPEMISGRQAFEKIGDVAVNSLLRCGEETALLSLDYSTAVALTDCSFGGEGNPPEQEPVQLPRSAAMLVEQFASMIAQVIADSKGTGSKKRGDVLLRSESVARLKPFATDADVASFSITLAQGAFAEWNVLLVIEECRLDALMPGVESASSNQMKPVRPAGQMPGCFATMPMELSAVLGEFELTLEKLETLCEGDEIPLAIGRELPLFVGEQVLGHGTIGTIDNHMALQLVRLSGGKSARKQGTKT